MIAEEELKELYLNPQREGFITRRPIANGKGVILLSPEDLIANLVVEDAKGIE